MDVTSSSPAPRSTARSAHATDVEAGPFAAALHDDLPARRTTVDARRRASIATTTACRPKRDAQREMSVGSVTAAVFSDTLSAPARRTSRISTTLRTPPPTVSGTNARRAVRSTMSRSVPRPSGARRDVEEHELVGPLVRVARGQLGRIALVRQVDEAGALDDPAVRDVEARDHPPTEHQSPPASRPRRSAARPSSRRPTGRPTSGRRSRGAAGRCRRCVRGGTGRPGRSPRATADTKRRAMLRLGQRSRPRRRRPCGRRHRNGRSRSRRRRRCRRTTACVAAALDLIPADVGQRRRIGQADGPPGKDAQRLGAVLVARRRTAAGARGRCRGTVARPRPSRRMGVTRPAAFEARPSPAPLAPTPGRRAARRLGRSRGVAREPDARADGASAPGRCETRLPAP